MGESDPHIHVGVDLSADAEVRKMMASTFGLVTDLAGVVATGCGLRVPRAMTSPLPERVTCLACREHAGRQHLHYAEQLECLNVMPGVNVSTEQARVAASRHRDLAEKFSRTD